MAQNVREAQKIALSQGITVMVKNITFHSFSVDLILQMQALNRDATEYAETTLPFYENRKKVS